MTRLTVAGVILAAAGILVALIIAWLQGVFRRARLRVKLGLTETAEKAWAAFVVVPDLAVTHYVFTVPIEVINVGEEAIRSVRLQVRHDKAGGVLNLNKADISLYKKLETRLGINRSDTVFGPEAISDYEFAVVRRDEGAVVGHLLAIPKQLLFERKKPRIWVSRIQLQVTAENSRLLVADAYIVAAGTRDGKPEPEIGQKMGECLLEESRAHERRAYVVWKWRRPDKALETRPIITISPRWVVAKPGVAMEGQLVAGGETTQYNVSTVDIIDLTPRALERRAKQTR